MNKNIRSLIAVAAALFYVGSVCAQTEFKQTRYPNGKLRTEERLLGGKREGMFRDFYPSGKPREEIPYRAGNIHGTRKFYYETGQVAAEIPYLNGDKDGIARKFSANGKLTEEVVYKNDRYNGYYKTFYPSGNPEEESHFVDNLRQGRAVWYHDNKKPKRIAEYDRGNVNGLERGYSPGGVLQLKSNPDGLPTVRQAIAYDRGIRALNRDGYAALDVHPANFYFRKTGLNDDWVMVILDPGGIVPVKGVTAAERGVNARKLQGLVDNPIDRAPGNPKERGPFEYPAKAYRMQSSLQQFVDMEKTQFTSIDEIYSGSEPIFRPSGAEDFPKVRQLFGKSDEEIDAAYRELREQYGQR